MTAAAVIGAQWGDEAKGKITHFLARKADCTVRFNGGPNAGHTVKDRYGTAKLHHIPVGALHEDCAGILAHGMAIDPWILQDELAALESQGRPMPKLGLSERAHLILPHHRLREQVQGSAQRIGTTCRGIGPCYEDRAGRRGLRLGDLTEEEAVRAVLQAGLAELEAAGCDGPYDIEKALNELRQFHERARGRIGDMRAEVEAALVGGNRVIFEGAQGTLLDLDWGTYPYVTSSSTTVHGVGWGTGIRMERLTEVIGVVKAYTTRVGEGPFPTEDCGAAGEQLRKQGDEYGTTTGRPRRCGWLDLVALRYACKVNGFTGLALTKLDVLTGFADVKLCVAYRKGAGSGEVFPTGCTELSSVEPVYEALPGWSEDIKSARAQDALPRAARRLLSFVEDYVGVPVTLVGVGPAEEEIVVMK